MVERAARDGRGKSLLRRALLSGLLLALLSPPALADRVVVLRVPAGPSPTPLRLVPDLDPPGKTIGCVAPCSLRVAPGDYTAFVEGAEPSRFRFNVSPEAEELQLRFPKPGRRRVALVLIAVGVSLLAGALTGAGLWALACAETPCSTGVSNASGAAGVAAIVAGEGGSLLGIIGQILWQGTSGGVLAAR